MATVIGWDVGGANVKATRIDDAIRDPGAPRVVSLPFENLACQRRLPQVLQAALARLAGGFPDAMALTMTAELSDVFATKREGVTFVLDSFESAFPGCPAYTLSLSGEFSPLAEARSHPLDFAAANWLAERAVGRSLAPTACSSTWEARPPTSYLSWADGWPPRAGRTWPGCRPASWSIPACCAPIWQPSCGPCR